MQLGPMHLLPPSGVRKAKSDSIKLSSLRRGNELHQFLSLSNFKIEGIRPLGNLLQRTAVIALEELPVRDFWRISKQVAPSATPMANCGLRTHEQLKNFFRAVGPIQQRAVVQPTLDLMTNVLLERHQSIWALLSF